SILCSPECKIVGKILLDHSLSYALTATADVPVVYLQQFWKTVIKMLDTEDTIILKLDSQEIVYTVDMFCDTLKLPVETPNNPFITPVIIETIESFMQTGVFWYQLIIAVFNGKYPSIPQRHDEDYHSIKDDTPLEYETVTPTLTVASPHGKKRKQRAGETSLPRKPIKVTIRQKKPNTPLIPPPGDDRERDKVAEATILSLTLHKTALAAEAQENIAKVQEKLDEEEIERIVEGEEDEESYASEFVDSMLNDDVDDFGTRIEPESYKGHPENVNHDDEEIEKEKKDDEIKKKKKDDDVEKTDEVVNKKDYDEVATGSMETMNEKMQTPIPTPTRSPKKDLCSDKIISEELTTTVSPTTTTTSKESSILKCKKRSISYKTKNLPGSIAGMCRRRGQICTHIKNKFITHDFFMGKIREVLDHCNKVVPEIMFAKTNEMIKEEMSRLVNLAVNKDREVDPINNTTLNLYPTTSSSTAEKSTASLQQQLYLNMKTKPQDQAANPELWEILKAKFEKS
ncbi:hypothetical protein Tco_0896683, partial [Tanacetum coccineum]